MKTYAEALEPDARYQIVMTDDPVDGLRPLSFRDHYDMVADLALPAGAPDVVVRIYARALNALIYGWLDYELMVVAAGQALAKGANYVVVGRPITRAADPIKVLAAMQEDILAAG